MTSLLHNLWLQVCEHPLATFLLVSSITGAALKKVAPNAKVTRLVNLAVTDTLEIISLLKPSKVDVAVKVAEKLTEDKK